VQLAVGELERFVGVEAMAGVASLAFKRGCDTLATAGHLQVALVGEDNRLGSPASSR
jgi:hypothetical protein